ncbi:MAG: hypothetical protein EXS00_05150 [Phycisphaerales bacterium]|nr:hypothetical protein [Phycisphaerales bacterium]
MLFDLECMTRRLVSSLVLLSSLCFAVLVSAQSAAPEVQESGQPTADSTRGIFDRVTIIGASVSAGFGVSVKFEVLGKKEVAHVDIADILIASVREGAPCPVISSYASGSMFFNPPVVGKGEIERALLTKPTLVLALDFLFWHAYGLMDRNCESIGAESERLDLLELGLSRLEPLLALGVPLLIGDLPDMQDAVGRMISQTQVPHPETLALLNARIKEWAAAHSSVCLLPLGEWNRALREGESVTLAGRTWSASDFGPLLQSDRLHPSLAGSIALLAGSMEVVQLAHPESESPFVLEPKKVEAALIASKLSRKSAAASEKPSPASAASTASPALPAATASPPTP